MKHNLLLLFCCLLVPGMQAQVLPYVFSVQNSPYIPLVNATSVNNGEVWDDLDIQVPLGFSFQFFGETTSSYNMAGDNLTINSFGLPTDPSPVLLSYGSDLVDRGYANNQSLSPISYKVEGAPGNRIFKMEWANAGFYDDGTGNDFTNTQVWLFEGSNNIELHFGPTMAVNPELFIDFTGPVFGFFHAYSNSTEEFDYLWYLKGPVSNPTVKLISSNDALSLHQTVTGMPGDGLVYRFSPAVVSVFDPLPGSSQVRVFPSIASQAVTIAVTEELARTEKDLQYEIIDQVGQTAGRGPVNGSSTQVDIASLPTGFYYVHLQSATGRIATKKIVKQ